MGILQTMCVLQLLFGILISPMLAFCQVIDTVIRYFEEGKHPVFYKHIEIYLLFVLVYLKLWAIFWAFSELDIIPDTYNLCVPMALYFMSIPLIIYNYTIINKAYPSSPKQQYHD